MTVQLSHLDKVFFPDDGITKGDLVSYYREMAPHILGYVRDRPLVLDRYPDGIAGQRIVQKNAGRHFPDWVRTTEVGKQGGSVCHVLADRPDTLVYLANQAAIELHIFLSRVGALDRPDQLVFDLDPPSGDRFGDVCRHALHLRAVLEDELGLTSYVKTTGGPGRARPSRRRCAGTRSRTAACARSSSSWARSAPDWNARAIPGGPWPGIAAASRPRAGGWRRRARP
jgi:bifunctional non-homologous end joining protein LigD